jgi:hypothetical protein
MISREHFLKAKKGDVLVGSDGWRLVVWGHGTNVHHPLLTHEEGFPGKTIELRYFQGKIVDPNYGAFASLNHPDAKMEVAAA